MDHNGITPEILRALLDCSTEPVVFVDNNHVIRYINRAAEQKYMKRGITGLVGSPLFACHNELSRKTILDVHESFMKGGEEERFLKINGEQKKVYMCAVRDPEGALLGYTERFERID